ncbi:conserved hypothetical protein (plasmid) [Thermomicrobium roseum DSM 5159]|uniref:Uncharacterized protein n=1 Tax=Thermomicrobium roseum (strain ATCC 27502 / DSM 5159 / P-2) TaxID=309801 RepID=B9L4K0_THERP|nr:conserved hypothetical protein [Thermomicrobium roseum DSM 5159]
MIAQERLAGEQPRSPGRRAVASNRPRGALAGSRAGDGQKLASLADAATLVGARGSGRVVAR